MPKAKTTRKQLFRSALGLAGLTARQWAEREGVTEGHLSHVLAGRESLTLVAKIDAIVKREFSKHSALAS